MRVRSTSGRAVVRGDRDRLARALGNVMSNAVEHGGGDVSVLASRSGDRLRIEVTNPVRSALDGRPREARGLARGGAADWPRDRGRGLEIAADAAAEAGGALTTAIGPRRARAVIELPLEP
jgi:two-component system sensor histidine kinase MtrB